MSATIETFDLVQKASFVEVYTNVGLMAVGCGIVLALITPILKRLMHGASQFMKNDPVKKNMDKIHKPRTHKVKTKYIRKKQSNKIDEL